MIPQIKPLITESDIKIYENSVIHFSRYNSDSDEYIYLIDKRFVNNHNLDISLRSFINTMLYTIDMEYDKYFVILYKLQSNIDIHELFLHLLYTNAIVSLEKFKSIVGWNKSSQTLV